MVINMDHKRVSIYIVKPSNVKFNENFTLHHNIRHVDLSLEKIYEILSEGQQVTELLPDYTEEPLTLENYADENLYQAVEERRTLEHQMREEQQEYEKEKFLEFVQKKREGTINVKQYEREMYADFETKRTQVSNRIVYLQNNTRGTVAEL